MRKHLIILISAFIMLTLSWQPTVAQSYPDPKVELVSIVNNHTYQETSKVSFTLEINRFNNSKYADQIRIWLCPEPNWTGSVCTAGFIAISFIPTSTATTAVMSTSEVVLNPGNYLVTSVTFKNGAVLSGYTLAYLRAGSVTIGGLTTTMPWVDITSADFSIPAPEPEVILEPESEPESEPDSESQLEFNPSESESTSASQGDTSELSDNLPNDGTSTSDSSNLNESTRTDSEPTDLPQPYEDEANNTTNPENNSNAESDSAESTQSEATPPTSVSEEGTNSTQGEEISIDEGDHEVTTQITPEIADTVSQEVPIALESESNNNLTTETQAENQPIQVEVIIQDSAKPEDKVVTESDAAKVDETVVIVANPTEVSISPTNTQSMPVINSIAVNKAAGGFITKVIGSAKLEKVISAGVGKLRLFGSSKPAILKVKIGSKEITRLKLDSKNQFTIKWYSKIATKLKLVLIGGDDAELLIDSLQINRQLIANPTFLMRN